jgi:hypothetical protein
MKILGTSLAGTNLSRLPGLRSLNLEKAPEGTAQVTTGCDLINFATSLEELRVDSFVFIAPGFDNSGFRMQPNTSALVELHLRECHISSSTLEQWIKSCRSLRAFTYTAGYYAHHDVNAAQLLEALRSCTDTLERLDADFSEHYGSEIDYSTSPQGDASNVFKYQGFREFTKLEHLRIEAVRLEGVDTLPPCLKTLTLTLFEIVVPSVTRRHLDDFHNMRRGQCTALETVRLQYGCMSEAEMQSMMATLDWTDEEHGRERGVEMVLECDSSH